jgi:type IV pilus assembly protein PilA
MDPSRRIALTLPRRTVRTLARLRERSRDESGFGLVEVLVVILIIGVLAAIALPAFLNQKTKAYDAAAKELVHSAAITAETIATDNNGEYTKVTKAELNKYEPTIQTAAGGGNAYISSTGTPSSNSYRMTATAASTGDEFTISKSSTGAMTRTCTSPKGKTDCSGSETGSW